ncbi:MAG TPA: DUF447 family protein [Candidatus Syntrophoarchaeum butanivorans]|uniref:DUF447 family protein n=1 Tax=Candidatus Syntropharchaeum butanivorans TaxID=1839936 RepID=A0A7C0X050_9EURY|nr:DUF447 family protein [Candidatus Syntrophoarchaeum butanivorans]
MDLDLTELGIGDGIWEVVATTRSRDGVPNAAPLGLRCREGDLSILVFEPSRTLENILDTGRIGVNILQDPLIFVKSVVGDLDNSYYTDFKGFPVINGAEAWIILEAKLMERGEAYLFTLVPLSARRNFKAAHPVNRGFNAIIEALILATRYSIMDESERDGILRCIEHMEEIVRKCGGDREHEAMAILKGYLHRIQELEDILQ